MKKKLLLIGWDAADWKVINPLMDSGQMPNLKTLVESGSMGKLASLDPPLSPMLWTSISTGKRPYKHGIHGFTEPDPSGIGVRPMHITSRTTKALWNIFTQNNITSNIIGWWPSYPAEPIKGNYVSNFYQKANKEIDKVWKLPDGCIHPKSMEEIISHLRVHPQELTEQHIIPFVPRFNEINLNDPKMATCINSLSTITAHTACIHNAATYLLEHTDWDFSAVYFDGIDHYSHGFMKYHPPKMSTVAQEEYEIFQNVITSAYRYHDMMLGRLMALAGPDTSIMLISDHGFHPGNLRPKFLPKNEHAAPAMEHSPYGIFVWKGQGIKKDAYVHGINLLDIAPTILNYFNLPVGLDMDGKIIVSAFEVEPSINTIESWDDEQGEAGLLTHETKPNSEEAKEAIQQLIDLGYIDEESANSDKAREMTIEMNEFFLARAYFDGGEFLEALAIFENLFERNPGNDRYGIRLANTYRVTGQMSKLSETLETIKELVPIDSAGLLLMEAIVLMSKNKNRSAVKLLDRALELKPDLPSLNMYIGRSLLTMNLLEKAETAFRRELEFDDESQMTYNLLGILYLRQNKFDQALECLFQSVGLNYNNANAHMHIGICMFHLEKYEYAILAFDVALKLSPGYLNCYNWLHKIYSEKLKDQKKADEIMEMVKTRQQREIIVVSGLPRSGTSMMMQMLQAGGIELFCDNKRIADENNPKGYYEHEAVKSLKKYNAFLGDIGNKAVKIVAELLHFLPPKFKYKIIFMKRDVRETNLSQLKMLERLGMNEGKKSSCNDKSDILGTTLKRVELWNQESRNVEMIYIDFAETINNPEKSILRVSQFLGKELDMEAMVKVVDKELYREKLTS